ncbi:UNKNOWN [Stylonychia lemnae]|uniref:Dickkopf N-terminal cysteine-rich domain-containing protein n=1 Tax=Stylonychia lemnae TaxID=5949 RepID=A0A078AGC3_STYLE|nr:UNKNOWN [Stylonychia lemnae]|eukprot:CDW80572.1 UNKNOWN [Stylonychia lemnae]
MKNFAQFSIIKQQKQTLAIALFTFITLTELSQEQCIKANCISKVQTTSSLCLRQTDGTAITGGNVQFVGDQCDSTNRYYCDPSIDQNTQKYTGQCTKNNSQFEYLPTYIQFPGELCDERRALFECGFGYRKCMAKRCYGYLQGENCINSADCNPHLYCDQSSKTCKYALQSEGLCTSSDQCDMGQVCKFDSNLAAQGRCKKYFSLATGTPVYAKVPHDLFVCQEGFGALDSNQKYFQLNLQLVPVLGVIDVRTFQPGLYRCGKEINSINAGKNCTTYSDCPSNVQGVFAQCGCTYSGTNKKCDILHSNFEYQQFLDAVICFVLNLMCKKMKAFYYLPNYDADQCLLTHSNQYLFSEIDETQLWCDPDRYSVLLGLDTAMGRVILNLAVMIGAMSVYSLL